MTPEQRHLLRLQRAKATEEAEAEVERWRPHQSLRGVALAFSNAERELAFAKERDAIQATRPAGCWCLGLGGRNWKAFREGYDDGPGHYLEYCGCNAGQAAREADTQSRIAVEAKAQERRRAAAAERAEQFQRTLPVHFRSLSLETYPTVTHAQRRIVESLQAWVQSGREQRPWLLIHGQPGLGKTGLCIGVADRMIRDGYVDSAMFVTVRRLFAQIQEGYDARGDVNHLDRALGADLLILDEVGGERATTWSRETLEDLIGERHAHHAPTLITTNKTPKMLLQHTGERVFQRILELSTVLGTSDLTCLRVRESVESPRRTVRAVKTETEGDTARWGF